MIVAGSLRQLPYSLRVEGRQTYIVGYAFTPTGVEEPTVGNDWYPLDLDVFDNVEYASVDAYIASEEGQATLQGCGVSGLVPLETAVARLADNGINITVVQNPTLFNRQSLTAPVLVNQQGKACVFSGSTPHALVYNEADDSYNVVDMGDSNYNHIAEEYGVVQIGAWPGFNTFTLDVDGVSYTFTYVSGTNFKLSPAAGTYN